MELRKNTRAPRRFENECSKPGNDVAYISPGRTQRSIKSRFKVPFTPFNPSLPPAAFPTLDFPRALDKRSETLAPPYSTEARLQLQDPNQQPVREGAISDMNAAAIAAIRSGKRRDTLTLSVSQRSHGRHGIDEPNSRPQGLTDQEKLAVAATVAAEKETAWRNDMETTIEQMGSSEEDEAVETTGNGASSAKIDEEIVWNDLAMVHRMDIVNGLEDKYGSRKAAYQMIDANNMQQYHVDMAENKRRQQLESEDVRIGIIQDQLKEAYLQSEQTITNTIGQVSFRRLFEDNTQDLWNEARSENSTTTQKQLDQAQTWLKDRALPLELLQEWDVGGMLVVRKGDLGAFHQSSANVLAVLGASETSQIGTVQQQQSHSTVQIPTEKPMLHSSKKRDASTPALSVATKDNAKQNANSNAHGVTNNQGRKADELTRVQRPKRQRRPTRRSEESKAFLRGGGHSDDIVTRPDMSDEAFQNTLQLQVGPVGNKAISKETVPKLLSQAPRTFNKTQDTSNTGSNGSKSTATNGGSANKPLQVTQVTSPACPRSSPTTPNLPSSPSLSARVAKTPMQRSRKYMSKKSYPPGPSPLKSFTTAQHSTCPPSIDRSHQISNGSPSNIPQILQANPAGDEKGSSSPTAESILAAAIATAATPSPIKLTSTTPTMVNSDRQGRTKSAVHKSRVEKATTKPQRASLTTKVLSHVSVPVESKPRPPTVTYRGTARGRGRPRVDRGNGGRGSSLVTKTSLLQPVIREREERSKTRSGHEAGDGGETLDTCIVQAKK